MYNFFYISTNKQEEEEQGHKLILIKLLSFEDNYTRIKIVEKSKRKIYKKM